MLASQLHRRAKSLGTLCKILLAHFQVMHVFTQLPSVQWPPTFVKFLEYFSIFSFDLFSVSPLGCTLGFDAHWSVQQGARASDCLSGVWCCVR